MSDNSKAEEVYNLKVQALQTQSDKVKVMVDDINSGKNKLTAPEMKQLLLDILAVVQTIAKIKP